MNTTDYNIFLDTIKATGQVGLKWNFNTGHIHWIGDVEGLLGKNLFKEGDSVEQKEFTDCVNPGDLPHLLA